MRRRRVVFALLLAVQFAVLYAPRAAANPGDLPLDKLVHAVVFGAVAWAGVRAGLPARPLVVLLIGHAVLSEVVQDRWLPHRSGDPWDAVADTFGTLVGVVLGTRADGRR